MAKVAHERTCPFAPPPPYARTCSCKACISYSPFAPPPPYARTCSRKACTSYSPFSASVCRSSVVKMSFFKEDDEQSWNRTRAHEGRWQCRADNVSDSTITSRHHGSRGRYSGWVTNCASRLEPYRCTSTIEVGRARKLRLVYAMPYTASTIKVELLPGLPVHGQFRPLALQSAGLFPAAPALAAEKAPAPKVLL